MLILLKEVTLTMFSFVSLQIKAKNYDKVEKVSSLKYILKFKSFYMTNMVNKYSKTILSY